MAKKKAPAKNEPGSFSKLNDFLNTIAPDGEILDINPIAKIDELNILRERIDLLEEKLELEKQEHAELQKRYSELESTSDAQEMVQQKKTYESYILTLQTELYDIKHKFDESERLRTDQDMHIDRLEGLMAQISAQMDQEEAIPPQEPVIERPKTLREELLGEIKESIQKPQAEPLLGQTPPAQTKQPSVTDGLLGDRPLSPEEQVNYERNEQLTEFYNELVNRFNEIKDMAFVGFDGQLHFQTSAWDITSDIFKLIQDWKAEAPAVWLSDMKYATIKATDEILVATNVQGKGHLLCSALDEKLFMICQIDISGDALLLYEDLQPMLPHLKNIFDAYAQKKSELL